MRVHFVMHEPYEAPGAIEEWAHERKHEVGYSRVYAAEPLPKADELDFLVVMGGPQSPSTTKEECPYFDAAAEMALIRACVESRKLVLGVCLGAQLTGESLGAKTEHSPQPEIGCHPIYLTEAGFEDPNLADFGSALMSGHWHNDMPGLTPQAAVLAYSERCPRQIIRYGERVYGFQCHLEFNRPVVREMLNSSPEISEATADSMLRHDYSPMNSTLKYFLDAFTSHFQENLLPVEEVQDMRN
jgi:GMP synthase (glutamine-hydrolysing)